MGTQFAGIPVRPYKALAVNAGSSINVDYSCRNPDEELETPTVLRYRIDSLTEATVVADWATVSVPADEGSITISAATNAMTRQYRDRELRQVTFEATFADGSKVQSLCHYELCAVFQGSGN